MGFRKHDKVSALDGQCAISARVAVCSTVSDHWIGDVWNTYVEALIRGRSYLHYCLCVLLYEPRSVFGCPQVYTFCEKKSDARWRMVPRLSVRMQRAAEIVSVLSQF